MQSHPFTIASWSESEKLSLDFLIELRNDFMWKLFNCVLKYQKENISVQVMKEGNDSQSKADDIDKRLFDDVRDSYSSLKHSDLCITFFSESHCSGVLIDDYRKVLMIITEFEIRAQLLFLKELIQEFNQSEIHTHNIHLIWQLCDLDEHLHICQWLNMFDFDRWWAPCHYIA